MTTQIHWITTTDPNKFESDLATAVIKKQREGYEIIDIKYSSVANNSQILFSALIIFK